MAQLEPGEWNEWLVFGGAMLAIAAWFRKAILRLILWFRNLVSIPKRVEEMAKIMGKIDLHTQTTLALTRASWDTKPHPVWHSDIDGKCIHINLAFKQLVGCQPSEILGDGWRTIIHQDDKDRVFREWDSCTQQRRDFDMEYRWKTRQGLIHHVHARASRILLPDGTLVGWMAFVEVLPTPTQGATP